MSSLTEGLVTGPRGETEEWQLFLKNKVSSNKISDESIYFISHFPEEMSRRSIWRPVLWKIWGVNLRLRLWSGRAEASGRSGSV